MRIVPELPDPDEVKELHDEDTRAFASRAMVWYRRFDIDPEGSQFLALRFAESDRVASSKRVQ
jgi:hypothetical protein